MRTLFGYYRSSAAYRVRIALNLKGLDYRHEAVNLLPGVSEQRSAQYLALNPQGRVPYFIDEGGTAIGQSPAIIEYLDEAYPDLPLLPTGLVERAYVRQIASLIACDIHPLNNLSVLGHLKAEFGVDEAATSDWYRHWIRLGFTALEALLVSAGRAGRCCLGDTPGLADAFLVPQVYNAHRFKLPMADFPTIQRLTDACNELDAFRRAAPENQPDCPAA